MNKGEELLDTNGRTIKVGQKVVYNQSGYLVEGVVRKIAPRKTPNWRVQSGYQYYGFTIENSKTGKMSKVLFATSIFVI